MGADMHVIQEVKFNGDWHCYGYRKPNRNYELFGMVGNVRCYDENVLAPNRGVPKDIAFMSAAFVDAMCDRRI